jgi:hypothetical protein
MKAFPQPVALIGDVYHAGDELVENAGGMTLRDWFAGLALGNPAVHRFGDHPETMARNAYAISDAMLGARDL